MRVVVVRLEYPRNKAINISKQHLELSIPDTSFLDKFKRKSEFYIYLFGILTRKR